MHPAQRKRLEALAPFLQRLTQRYHRAELLGSDPLCMVHRFQSNEDREIAGLLSALLAYGNVKQINRSLHRLFAAMGEKPAQFVCDFSWTAASRALAGFKHRFADEQDVLCLLWLLHQALQKHGSLENVFLQGYQPEEPDLALAAGRFVDTLYSGQFTPHFDKSHMVSRSSFKHLLPRADKGSACKRIHLWLRWMIRPADTIDLGLWKNIPPSKLVMPLDTHITRIGYNLGLITSPLATLRNARTMTAALSVVSPDDPVHHDFSICRLGILKKCPTTSDLSICRECEMHDVCRQRQRLQRNVARRAHKA